MSIFKTIKAQVISAFKWSFNAASERLYTAAQLDRRKMVERSRIISKKHREMAQYKASALNSRYFVSDLCCV